MQPSRCRRHALVAISLTAVVAAMAGLSFAAVPLYRLFCQVTGYGGTTQEVKAAPGKVGDRVIAIEFNADVSPALPWRFRPVQRRVSPAVGERALVYYRAENLSDKALTGTATFNVTPHKAGVYFDKIECFCFTEQHLGAGESADLPVSFFIDPKIVGDPNLDDVNTITLSYTFFPVRGATGGKAPRRSARDPAKGAEVIDGRSVPAN